MYARYIKDKNVHKEFVGFFPLQKFDAKFISKTILEACYNMDLDMNQYVGQGYDGCATIAGYIFGVQKKNNEVYPISHFFHCANYHLNLVINDFIFFFDEDLMVLDRR